MISNPCQPVRSWSVTRDHDVARCLGTSALRVRRVGPGPVRVRGQVDARLSAPATRHRRLARVLLRASTRNARAIFTCSSIHARFCASWLFQKWRRYTGIVALSAIPNSPSDSSCWSEGRVASGSIATSSLLTLLIPASKDERRPDRVFAIVLPGRGPLVAFGLAQRLEQRTLHNLRSRPCVGGELLRFAAVPNS